MFILLHAHTQKCVEMRWLLWKTVHFRWKREHDPVMLYAETGRKIAMKRVFGVKKEKAPVPTVAETTERVIDYFIVVLTFHLVS